MTRSDPFVTVLIPTLDAGPRLRDVLEAVLSQRTGFSFEVRAIDSGSTDETRHILEEYGITYRTISTTEFNHGSTRTEGVLESAAGRVALLSQDARPVDTDWLAELASALEDDTVAGAWSRQIPARDCHPFQLVNRERAMETSAQERVLEPFSLEQWRRWRPQERLSRIGFDNVASIVRREAIAHVPFPHRDFGEDLAWSREVLLAGWRLVYKASAVVEHSHGVSRFEFGERVRLNHRALKEIAGFVPIPNRLWWLRRTAGQSLRLARAAVRDRRAAWPARLTRAATALPWAVIQMNAMYLGGIEAQYLEPSPLGGTTRDGDDQHDE